MPNYAKGTMGKIIVQDWNVVSGYSPENVLYILTRQQANALIAIATMLYWPTRWENSPGIEELDAFASETIFNLMNPVDCEVITECIQPLLDAQTIEITNNILNQIAYGTQDPGQPLTGSQSAANIAGETNPTCELDILWSQCLSIVQFTNRQIVDVLEKVEVASNIVELVALIDEVPILGFVAQQFGSELATQAINYFQEAVLEGYQAQYDETVENAIACELFCACRDDCIVSVDRIFGVFQQRLSSLIPTNPGDLIDLIELLAGVDFDGTEVVDICFYFAWGAAKLAQFIFGENLSQATLTTLLALAVDDASGDWSILCTDCPTSPVNINIYWPDLDETFSYTLGIEYTVASYDAGPGDNRVFFTADGCFNVEVVAVDDYNPSPFLQPTNYWYGTADCDSGPLVTHNASGTGGETPLSIDTTPGVSQYVVSNADLGAFTMTIKFTVP